METVLQVLAGENERVSTKILLDIFVFLAGRDSTLPADKLKEVIKQLSAEV
jgi:hypothetical protein